MVEVNELTANQQNSSMCIVTARSICNKTDLINSYLAANEVTFLAIT